ncbi:MAG: hypothetical protein NTW52_16935 [Planctomycetota bacterium]|jgi:hypothetical protein|nr:hypothetical protein [Planctomycetota bacterium]
MTDNSRRAKIEAMLVDEPNDDFLRYALAMEMRKDGESEASIKLLASMARQEKPHVASFFMAAQQLVALDRIAAARTFLRDGIEEARLQNDHHAAGEMSEYLSQLGESGE